VREIFKYLHSGVEVSWKQNKLETETSLSKMFDVIMRTVQRATTDFMEFVFWEQFVSLFAPFGTVTS
jgi:hypothetical protein